MAAPPTTQEEANWAVDRATSLPELWALVAEHGCLVAAWRLTRLCMAARAGAKDWLRTLPGFVVCGGYNGPGTGSSVKDVLRLAAKT